MNKRGTSIDLVKLMIYILKRIWLVILCAVIGFAFMYWQNVSKQTVTYTASGTMYVYNGNPDLVNYQYASVSDLNSAVQLVDTYMVVVKSNKVMDVVAERLSEKYPSIQPAYIAGTISMSSVKETGVTRVTCVTDDGEKSADICNAVLDVAPQKIIEVVGAGHAEVIDYAVAPTRPDARNPMRKAVIGALGGAVAAGALLAVLFMLNRKVQDAQELTDSYTPPVLSSVRRSKEESENPGKYLLSDKSPMEVIESYAKLRMNLLYTLIGKDSKVVEVTSAISGEGKSTITANLAISCAMSGKRVLLMDGDMRRASQREIFSFDKQLPGLSDVLVGTCSWREVLLQTGLDAMEILPAGHIPPNPAELLDSPEMLALLKELSAEYDLILLDAPPINIVSDPLALSAHVAGSLFVVRQDFSDHREVRKALISAEMTGMNVLGFVFYGEKLHQGGYYYNRKYYNNYYKKYDSRNRDRANA